MRIKSILSIFIFSFLILSACSNEAYDEAMEDADQAIENKEYTQAITHFETAIEAKKKDDIAPHKLKKTELFVEGSDLVAEGKLNEAEEIFMFILDLEDEDEFLHNETTAQIVLIESLKETSTEVETQMDRIRDLSDEADFEEAFVEIEALMKEDFSHPFLQPLQDDLVALEEELTREKQIHDEERRLKVETEQMEEALSKVEKLGNEKKYTEAIKLIDKTLKTEISEQVKDQFSDEFNELRKAYEKLLEANKKKAEADKVLNSMYGYWQHEDFSNDFIYINPTYFYNLAYNTDVSYDMDISNYAIDLDKKELILTVPSGDVSSIKYSNNTLHLVQGDYIKITEHEVENGRYPADLEDFKRRDLHN